MRRDRVHLHCYGKSGFPTGSVLIEEIESGEEFNPLDLPSIQLLGNHKVLQGALSRIYSLSSKQLDV